MDDPQTEMEVAVHNVGSLFASVTTQLDNAKHALDLAEGALDDLRAAVMYAIALREDALA